MESEKRKTWKDLKKFISKLTPKQLNSEVLFQDDYDNLTPVNFYIADKYGLENVEWDTPVKPKYPYFGL